MSEFTASDVSWCLQTFKMLAVGGVWGVPRSGLIFRKSEEPLVMELQSVMPYDESMPLSEEEFHEYQHDDFNVIKYAFKQAGIEVRDGGLL